MDRYAVVGNPIAHSKSPVIHGLFAEQTGQALTYDKMLVELTSFDEEVAGFFALGGKGLNVTVPFKEQAYRYADELSGRARAAGAVNTLIVQTEGTVWGDNTDGVGLVADLLAQGWALAGKRILILGAGGAVRGIVGPLLEQNPQSLVIANRTLEKAAAIAQAFPTGAIGVSAYTDLQGDFDLIINGTSASLGGELPPLPGGIANANSAAYDLMYGAEPTTFLHWAEEQGVGQRSDGLGMLVEQAAEAFFLWRGVRPETAPVIARLREMIAAA
ncbi:MAG: shikimate dehydrogenase [Cellvibrionaceae bacterium]|nr:shikimate dehydrogenase [Cellvibrionaceae bacterium]